MSRLRYRERAYTEARYDQYTGSEFGYEYVFVPSRVAPESVREWCLALRGQLANNTKIFKSEDHALWVARHYVAVKLIVAATVMLGSERWGVERGIQISSAYLRYYALFSCCRAYLLTSPNALWQEGKLLRIGHEQTAILTYDLVRHFDKSFAVELEAIFARSRRYRELGSYGFPGGALINVPGRSPEQDFDGIFDACAILCELAELQSECTFSAVKRHMPQWHTHSSHVYAILEKITHHALPDGTFFRDSDDQYQMIRNLDIANDVLPLFLMLNEGAVDDLFGRWELEDALEKASETAFNPQDYVYSLFGFL